MARQANPHLDEFGLVEFVERRWHEIPEHEWRRYFCNQWVARPAECWLPEGAWEQGAGDPTFDKSLPVFVGVDMALKHDSVAVVAVQVDAEGRARTQSRIWFPDGQTIDVAAVEAHLRDLHARWDVAEIAYDPAYFHRSAEVLADDGLCMLEYPQSAARMVPACQVAYEWINAGRVIHDGSPAFTDQILSAVPRQTDTGWRLSKGKSKRKIDAAIALGDGPVACHRTTRGAAPVGAADRMGVIPKPCLGCRRLTTNGSRCRACASAFEASSGRRADKAARYDAAYRRVRASWAPTVSAGGVPCARCGQLIVGRFDLDHVGDSLWPGHPMRNRAAGGQRQRS